MFKTTIDSQYSFFKSLWNRPWRQCQILLAFGLCLTSAQQGLAQRDHLEKEIKKLIKFEADVKMDIGSGYVISVIDGDSIYVYTHGSLAKGNSVPMTDTTLFEIGGLTHLNLLLLTYHMMELGLFTEESTLADLAIVPFEHSPIGRLTIGRLLSHSTGLPKILTTLTPFKSDPDDPYRYIPTDTIDRHLQRWVERHGLPSDRQLHSQYNYYLLSKVLWKVIDTRVHREGIFIPEMRYSAFLRPEPTDGAHSIPALYTHQDREVGFQHFNGFLHTMGMISSLHDQIILTEILLRWSSREAFRNIALAVPVGKVRRGQETFSSGGFRWIKTKKSGNLYFINGVTKGAASFVGYLPQTSTAVIILANRGMSVHPLGIHILRMINYEFTRTY